jgi:rhodanese-related sulfurtransferase
MKRIGIAGIIAVVLAGTTLAFANQHSAVPANKPERDSDWMLSAMTLIHNDYEIAAAELDGDPAARFLVIDLRLPEDFARGGLPGARNIPEANLLAQIGSMTSDREQPILLYGYSEEHSIRSVLALRLLSFTHVFHVAGPGRFPGGSVS